MRTTRVILFAVLAAAAPALAAPTERRLSSNDVDASSFLWNDWAKFVETNHPNYAADDDPATAWVEGAPSSGAGEWIRIKVAPLAKTTKVKLKIRNGAQKSKDLFAANARAKDVTIRLLPVNLDKTVTLTDKDGWQEFEVTQASGPLSGVELRIGSVYEGGKTKDLAISDIQVFATSEVADNPALEKEKQRSLKAWRVSRTNAAKTFDKKSSSPFYPAYEVVTKDWKPTGAGFEAMLAAGEQDKIIGMDLKYALLYARKLLAEFDKLPHAQIAPKSTEGLPGADGVQLMTFQDVGESAFDESAFRTPMIPQIATMFRDQLRVTDLKDKLTPNDWAKQTGACKGDGAWVQRGDSVDGNGPQVVRALVVAKCGVIAAREGGPRVHREREIYIYDPDGRLVLTIAENHVEGYRWGLDHGKPMITGARSLLVQGKLIDAREHEND